MMYDSLLHYQAEVFVGVGEQGDVVERRTVDDEQVSDGAGLNDSEPAFHVDEARGGRGGTGEYLRRRKDAGADGELFVLANMGFAEQVSAEGDGDTGIAEDGETLNAGFAYRIDLGDRGWRQSKRRAILGQCFVSDERGYRDGACLCGLLCGMRVNEVAVLE